MKEILVSAALLKGIKTSVQNLTNLFNADNLSIDQVINFAKRQAWELKEMINGLYDMERLMHPQQKQDVGSISNELAETKVALAQSLENHTLEGLRASSLLLKKVGRLEAILIRTLAKEEKVESMPSELQTKDEDDDGKKE